MRTVTLVFDLATWFLFATHRLVIMIICAILFSNPFMYGLVMARTRFWNTHTHTEGKLYMPFRHLWRGHKNAIHLLVHRLFSLNVFGLVYLPRSM